MSCTARAEGSLQANRTRTFLDETIGINAWADPAPAQAGCLKASDPACAFAKPEAAIARQYSTAKVVETFLTSRVQVILRRLLSHVTLKALGSAHLGAGPGRKSDAAMALAGWLGSSQRISLPSITDVTGWAQQSQLTMISNCQACQYCAGGHSQTP